MVTNSIEVLAELSLMPPTENTQLNDVNSAKSTRFLPRWDERKKADKYNLALSKLDLNRPVGTLLVNLIFLQHYVRPTGWNETRKSYFLAKVVLFPETMDVAIFPEMKSYDGGISDVKMQSQSMSV